MWNSARDPAPKNMVEPRDIVNLNTAEETVVLPARGDGGKGRNDEATTIAAGLLVHEEIKRQKTDSSAISFLANETMTLYQRLFVALHDRTDEQCAENGVNLGSTLVKVKDSRARFKGWAVPIAALQAGRLPSSLDYRLRDASEIRERILKILKQLQESLLSATSIVLGQQPNETWLVGASSDSEEEEIEEDDSHFEEGEQETSELDELLAAMNSSNISLMKLTMVIRSSPARDDYLKAAARYGDIPSVWDIRHVKEKHDSAKHGKEWMLERFGKAITRRRQWLKYRKEHHDKLSRDWDTDLETRAEAKSEQTKATTFIQTFSPVFESAESDKADSFGSQTSYEATMVGGSTESKLQVPPHPEMAFEGVPFEFGEPFQCPYCYTEQKVQNRAAWKKHVFRDLKPYVCTFKGCDLKMFRSRNEWFAHELQVHRREWICLQCQHQPFTSSDKFKQHLELTHQMTLDSEIDAIVRQSEEPVDKMSAAACPFCDEWEADLTSSKHDTTRAFLNDGKVVQPYGTIGKFRRHLGRHMEQLALFALPRYESGEIEDDSINEDDEDSQSDEVSYHVQADEFSVLANLYIGITGRSDKIRRAREAMESERNLMSSEQGKRAALRRYIDELTSLVDIMESHDDVILKDDGNKEDARVEADDRVISQLNREISQLRSELADAEATRQLKDSISSYWSVPEQSAFPQLLKFWGTDWSKIAKFLTGKTHIMVKNYYERQIKQGNRNFERYAAEADSRKAQGQETPHSLPEGLTDSKSSINQSSLAEFMASNIIDAEKSQSPSPSSHQPAEFEGKSRQPQPRSVTARLETLGSKEMQYLEESLESNFEEFIREFPEIVPNEPQSSLGEKILELRYWLDKAKHQETMEEWDRQEIVAEEFLKMSDESLEALILGLSSGQQQATRDLLPQVCERLKQSEKQQQGFVADAIKNQPSGSRPSDAPASTNQEELRTPIAQIHQPQHSVPPSAMGRMDGMPFPREYLMESNMPHQAPQDVQNWAQLKQFVVMNSMPPQTMERVKTLQSLHYRRLTRQQSSGLGGPLEKKTEEAETGGQVDIERQ